MSVALCVVTIATEFFMPVMSQDLHAKKFNLVCSTINCPCTSNHWCWQLF